MIYITDDPVMDAERFLADHFAVRGHCAGCRGEVYSGDKYLDNGTEIIHLECIEQYFRRRKELFRMLLDEHKQEDVEEWMKEGIEDYEFWLWEQIRESGFIER